MDAVLENPETSIQQKSALRRFFITYQSVRHSQWLLGWLSTTARTKRYQPTLAADAPTAHVLSTEWLNRARETLGGLIPLAPMRVGRGQIVHAP